MSPDLYTHSVSYFAEAPLSLFSPEAVRVFVYDCTQRPDARSAHLQAAAARAGATWRAVSALSEEAIADMVRADGIDILVELSGHTAFNRLGCLARRPAPVQVTWVGYPNSTGLREVDYRFTDSLCDPPDTAQTFVEELVRLPRCFLAYSPPATPLPPPVAPAPCVANGFVTFGSFNNLAKARAGAHASSVSHAAAEPAGSVRSALTDGASARVRAQVTPAVRALWARLLKAVPTARLVVKAKPFACPAVRSPPPFESPAPRAAALAAGGEWRK